MLYHVRKREDIHCIVLQGHALMVCEEIEEKNMYFMSFGGGGSGPPGINIFNNKKTDLKSKDLNTKLCGLIKIFPSLSLLPFLIL